jgi:hypothetical protein
MNIKRLGSIPHVAKVIAVDELGLWLENNAWKLEQEDGSFKSHTLQYLVLWRYVLSVGTFPDDTLALDNPPPPRTQEDAPMTTTLPAARIEQQIHLIRGHRVMLDADLADVYHVSTKRFNERVKRNINRFPPDFVFQLSFREFRDLRS